MAKLRVNRDAAPGDDAVAPKCAFHPDTIATGACEECAVFICDECRHDKDGKICCRDCAGGAPKPDPDGPACKNHPDRAPAAACQGCKCFLCEECAENIDGRILCPDCRGSDADAAAPAAVPVAEMAAAGPPQLPDEPATEQPPEVPVLAEADAGAAAPAAAETVDEVPAEAIPEAPASSAKLKVGAALAGGSDAAAPAEGEHVQGAALGLDMPAQKQQGMSTGKKVFLGVGIGCLALVLLVVIGFVGCFMKAKQTVKEIEAEARRQQQIAERQAQQHGTTAPIPDDGSDPRDRMVFEEEPDGKFAIAIDELHRCRVKKATAKLSDDGDLLITTRYKTAEGHEGALRMKFRADLVKRIRGDSRLLLNDTRTLGDAEALEVEVSFRPDAKDVDLVKRFGTREVFTNERGPEGHSDYPARDSNVFGSITFDAFGTGSESRIAGIIEAQLLPKQMKGGFSKSQLLKVYWRFEDALPKSDRPPTPPAEKKGPPKELFP